MRTKYIFGLLSLMLMVTFAFSILATSAMGANRKPVTAAGVIRGPDALILFTVEENFIPSKPVGTTGVYLIEVDDRLECRFGTAPFEGMQAALGPRLAMSAAFPGAFNNIFITSELIFVPTDIAGVCNATAVYQFLVWDRADDFPVNGTFSFQITGVRTK